MAKRTSRQEAKERSRQKLIQATIRVVSREGLVGATSGKIAKLAGLSQPSFYVHFADMEDALAEAAKDIYARLVPLLRESRLAIGIQASPDRIRASYAAAVTAYLDEPMATELYFRYRRNRRTVIGKLMNDLFDNERKQLIEDLRSTGVDESVVPQLDLFAELTISNVVAVVEGIRDGVFKDREAAIDGLALAGLGMFNAMANTPVRWPSKSG